MSIHRLEICNRSTCINQLAASFQTTELQRQLSVSLTGTDACLVAQILVLGRIIIDSFGIGSSCIACLLTQRIGVIECGPSTVFDVWRLSESRVALHLL